MPWEAPPPPPRRAPGKLSASDSSRPRRPAALARPVARSPLHLPCAAAPAAPLGVSLDAARAPACPIGAHPPSPAHSPPPPAWRALREETRPAKGPGIGGAAPHRAPAPRRGPPRAARAAACARPPLQRAGMHFASRPVLRRPSARPAPFPQCVRMRFVHPLFAGRRARPQERRRRARGRDLRRSPARWRAVFSPGGGAPARPACRVRAPPAPPRARRGPPPERPRVQERSPLAPAPGRCAAPAGPVHRTDASPRCQSLLPVSVAVASADVPYARGQTPNTPPRACGLMETKPRPHPAGPSQM
jgi:hypothetical protein